VRLTDEQGNHFDPRWSPDGQHLAYTWQREVWVMLADGTGRRQVSRGGGEHPSWEPVALTQK
jgi:Tol biopolymer transport system component